MCHCCTFPSTAVGRGCQHFPPSLPPWATQNSTGKSHSKQKLNGPGVNTIWGGYFSSAVPFKQNSFLHEIQFSFLQIVIKTSTAFCKPCKAVQGRPEVTIEGFPFNVCLVLGKLFMLMGAAQFWVMKRAKGNGSRVFSYFLTPSSPPACTCPALMFVRAAFCIAGVGLCLPKCCAGQRRAKGYQQHGKEQVHRALMLLALLSTWEGAFGALRRLT